MNPLSDKQYCPKYGYLAALLSVMGGSAQATGFDVPDQDAFAVSRGLAVVATANNPSAIFYNPAGLTQLGGHNVELGAYGISFNPKYHSPTTGRDYANGNSLGILPQIFYSYGATNSQFAAGLGIYTPSGLSVRWPQTTGMRTVGEEAALRQIAITPSFAYQVTPDFSVGAGVSANYLNLDLRQGIIWPAQPYDEFRFAGDGWAVSANLGFLYHVTDKWTVGGLLDTGAKVHLRGHVTADNQVAIPLYSYPSFAYRQSADANFQIPLKVKAGISYRPTPQWNLEIDAEYIHWDTVDTVNINQSYAVPPLFGRQIPLTLNWKDSWYYEAGVTRYFDSGWHISAGYIFNANSTSDPHYNPLVADEDRHFFSVGAGYQIGQVDLDVAYQIGYGPEHTVAGSAPSAGGQSADGTYSYLSHAVAVSLGVHF